MTQPLGASTRKMVHMHQETCTRIFLTAKSITAITLEMSIHVRIDSDFSHAVEYYTTLKMSELKLHQQ